MSTTLPAEVRDCLDRIDFTWIDSELSSGDLSHDDDGQRVRSVYLGSILYLTPSGKMYMPFACSNVDPCPDCSGAGCDTCGHVGSVEAFHDELFWETVDSELEKIDAWREESQGDGCDVLVCRFDESEELVLDGESLDGATNEFGRQIPVYDDGFGPLWIVRGAYGISRIIRAQTFQDAYEIHLDESPPIEDDEVHEAYGAFDRLCEKYPKLGGTVPGRDFLSRFAPEYFRAMTRNANQTGAWDNWKLIEGYAYQPNATGSGIVDDDCDMRIDQLTRELADELEITLQISVA